MDLANAIYGRGYIITTDEIDNLDKIIDNKYLIPLNYNKDIFFFGIIIYNVANGEYEELYPVERYDHKELSNMCNTFRALFPNHKERLKSYLLCIIN